jgi:hypothetical protein
MVGAAEVMIMVIQPPGHLVRDGTPMSRRDILGQSRDPQTLLPDDRPLIGLDLTLDQTEQGAFPLTVAPQQAEPLARLDLEVDLLEQPRAPEGQTDSAQTQ